MGPPGQGDVSAHLTVKGTQTPGSEVKFMDVRSWQGRARIWLCLSGFTFSLSSYDMHWPIACHKPGRGSSVECQKPSEHSRFCAKYGHESTCLQKEDHSFHQIFRAFRNSKPLRVTGLGIFSFLLFLLTETDADTPLRLNGVFHAKLGSLSSWAPPGWLPRTSLPVQTVLTASVPFLKNLNIRRIGGYNEVNFQTR